MEHILISKRQYNELLERAFHGTPYNFDKFKTDKIGTGEGAAAFGWGLYFTSSIDIANYYGMLIPQLKKDKYFDNTRFTLDDFHYYYLDDKFYYPKNYFKINNTKKDYSKIHNISDFREISVNITPLEFLNKLVEYLKRDNNSNRYVVEIMDDLTLLDWDKKVNIEIFNKFTKSKIGKKFENKHIKSVDEAKVSMYQERDDSKKLYNIYRSNKDGTFVKIDMWSGNEIEISQKEWIDNYNRLSDSFLEHMSGNNIFKSGRNFYETLQYDYFDRNPKKTSLFLKSIGIDGIKYRAGSITGIKSDDYNYVIFDENNVKIVDKQHI